MLYDLSCSTHRSGELMNYHENVLHLIGRTPLVRLGRMAQGIKATVLAKMESLNPGYSVKDRIGISMVEAAEREGTLKPGGTIVEATSGNTGIGLALTAAVKGYRCIFVMTEKASVEKVRYLKALGADVVVVPATAKPGTPDHYVETAGRIAHFVAGLGTGGTISGTGRYLKERNPNIRVVGADPYGSVFKTYKETGRTHEATPYLVEGIGQEVVPANVHIKYVDEIVNVTDRESFELARLLGRKEGIFCGGSTGTNLAAALRVARQLDETGVVVFIVCDTGEHYLTKFHSDEWLKEKRLLEPQKMTAGLISSTKGGQAPKSLVHLTPQTRVADALAKMDEMGLEHIPVIEEGKSIGSLRENRVLAKVLGNRDLLESPVSEVMGASFPVLDVDVSAADVTRQLQKSPAVLVEEYGRITGIITRHDMLDAPVGG